LDAGNAPIANNVQKIENEDDDEDDWRGAYTALTVRYAKKLNK
jgi:hypothetical protein